jgi:Bacterial surface proteins containing Ig-like domains
MNNKYGKYSITAILIMALVFGGAVYPGRKADAMMVWTEQVIYPQGGQAKKAEKKWCEFKAGNPVFRFQVPHPVGLSYEIQDTVTKQVIKESTVAADSVDWKQAGTGDQEETVYIYTFGFSEKDMPERYSGKYRITFFFDEDTEYALSAEQSCNSGYEPLPKPQLNKSKLTLTKGFQETLRLVYKHGYTLKWSSSSPSVASVDQKGVVKAKKAGTALITVEQSNGEKDYCDIRVKKNEYSAKIPAVRSVEKGTSLLKVCYVLPEKKALRVQAVFVNRTDHTAVRFRNLKIRMKNKKGKTIFTYKKKRVKAKVKPGRRKWFTFLIPKKKLKQKKMQDLRNSSVCLSRRVTFSLKK